MDELRRDLRNLLAFATGAAMAVLWLWALGAML